MARPVKHGKDIRVTVPMPMADKIRDLAATERRTVQVVVEMLLEKALKEKS